MCVPAQHCTQGLPSIPKQPTVLHEGDSLSSGISQLPKGLGGKWREGPLQESDSRLLQSLGPRTDGRPRRLGCTAWPAPRTRWRRRPPRRWAVAPAPEGPGGRRQERPGAE